MEPDKLGQAAHSRPYHSNAPDQPAAKGSTRRHTGSMRRHTGSTHRHTRSTGRGDLPSERWLRLRLRGVPLAVVRRTWRATYVDWLTAGALLPLNSHWYVITGTRWRSISDTSFRKRPHYSLAPAAAGGIESAKWDHHRNSGIRELSGLLHYD